MQETRYYNRVARLKHPEVMAEWVDRILANPDHSQTKFVSGAIRRLPYGFIDEFDRWALLVLTEDGRLLHRHIDRGALRRWGRPRRNS